MKSGLATLWAQGKETSHHQWIGDLLGELGTLQHGGKKVFADICAKIWALVVSNWLCHIWVSFQREAAIPHSHAKHIARSDGLNKMASGQGLLIFPCPTSCKKKMPNCLHLHAQELRHHLQILAATDQSSYMGGAPRRGWNHPHSPGSQHPLWFRKNEKWISHPLSTGYGNFSSPMNWWSVRGVGHPAAWW